MLNAPHMSHDITTAMRLLYGERVKVTSDLLKTIQPEELKSIFRQKALEFHPDRALILGKNPDEMSEKFKDVKLAYEKLREVLGNSLESIHITGDQRRTPTCDRRPNDPTAPGKNSQNTAGPAGNGHRQKRQKQYKQEQYQWIHEPGTHYWEADIPDTRLLFGQFLYYAGLIPWNTLISAITWQRLQRPSFGKIAKMWDYLTDYEIREIIASREMGEKLGESALRQGYLTHYQRSAVIGFQKWLQRPIGEFFQEIGILEEEEIRYLLKLAIKHNSRVVWSRW
jgi:hypothetical protein